MFDDKISKIFDESIGVISNSKSLEISIQNVIDKIIFCFENGNKIIIFGNGGSAADSQHFAAEFVGRFLKERNSLPAISLTTDTSILTALGNDYSFETIFSRQCESIVKKGDIVFGISTSGNSVNMINGFNTAQNFGGFTIGLLGSDGGKLNKISDLSIIIPSNSTPRIQESQRIILHIICEIVEEYFSSKK
ncbi:MAG: phosphoheptose isomerase [Thaumarchaeota archaeon]|jgi:D-sedoheptulose 7-phosphate isomerase|nr:MAG: phosphoheptose isomerase [Nitrososphaerota archaeon]